jgi:hypothetical protein
MATPGAQANSNGRNAERILMHSLQLQGIDCCSQFYLGDGLAGKLFADIYVYPCNLFPKGLAIESKWQQVQGTADEKLPYLWLNISEFYPCPCIVVIHGGGIRPKIVAWLKTKIGDQLLGVMSLEEFTKWTFETAKLFDAKSKPFSFPAKSCGQLELKMKGRSNAS